MGYPNISLVDSPHRVADGTVTSVGLNEKPALDCAPKAGFVTWDFSLVMILVSERNPETSPAFNHVFAEAQLKYKTQQSNFGRFPGSRVLPSRG